MRRTHDARGQAPARGGGIGATLPKGMAERLHLAVGDRVLAIETDRSILPTPDDPTT